jgi:hypothetical protein
VQRYSKKGQPVGNETRFHSYFTSNQRRAHVAVTPRKRHCHLVSASGRKAHTGVCSAHCYQAIGHRLHNPIMALLTKIAVLRFEYSTTTTDPDGDELSIGSPSYDMGHFYGCLQMHSAHQRRWPLHHLHTHPNFNGYDSFVTSLPTAPSPTRNRVGHSSLNWVSINVTPVNDAPCFEYSIGCDRRRYSQSITLAATDVDGDTLTYSVVTQPTRGTLSGSGAT